MLQVGLRHSRISDTATQAARARRRRLNDWDGGLGLGGAAVERMACSGNTRGDEQDQVGRFPDRVLGNATF